MRCRVVEQRWIFNLIGLRGDGIAEADVYLQRDAGIAKCPHQRHANATILLFFANGLSLYCIGMKYHAVICWAILAANCLKLFFELFRGGVTKAKEIGIAGYPVVLPFSRPERGWLLSERNIRRMAKLKA